MIKREAGRQKYKRENQAKTEAHAAAAHNGHSETNRDTIMIETVCANRVAIANNGRARYSAMQSQVLSNSKARLKQQTKETPLASGYAFNTLAARAVLSLLSCNARCRGRTPSSSGQLAVPGSHQALSDDDTKAACIIENSRAR